jgi:hypothetical protein
MHYPFAFLLDVLPTDFEVYTYQSANPEMRTAIEVCSALSRVDWKIFAEVCAFSAME